MKSIFLSDILKLNEQLDSDNGYFKYSILVPFEHDDTKCRVELCTGRLDSYLGIRELNYVQPTALVFDSSEPENIIVQNFTCYRNDGEISPLDKMILDLMVDTYEVVLDIDNCAELDNVFFRNAPSLEFNIIKYANSIK